MSPGDDDGTRRGLVLLAHGARDPAWATPFEAAAGAVVVAGAHR